MKQEFEKEGINIHNYKEEGFLDGNGFKKYDSIICSVESLHYIPEGKTFDLIIMDECESILKQFNSATAKASYMCFHILHSLVKKCKKIVYADAFISNRTIDYVETFNEYNENNEIINE